MIFFFTSSWKARRRSASVRAGATTISALTPFERTTPSSAPATSRANLCSSRSCQSVCSIPERRFVPLPLDAWPGRSEPCSWVVKKVNIIRFSHHVLNRVCLKFGFPDENSFITSLYFSAPLFSLNRFRPFIARSKITSQVLGSD